MIKLEIYFYIGFPELFHAEFHLDVNLYFKMKFSIGIVNICFSFERWLKLLLIQNYTQMIKSKKILSYFSTISFFGWSDEQVRNYAKWTFPLINKFPFLLLKFYHQLINSHIYKKSIDFCLVSGLDFSMDCIKKIDLFYMFKK